MSISKHWQYSLGFCEWPNVKRMDQSVKEPQISYQLVDSGDMSTLLLCILKELLATGTHCPILFEAILTSNHNANVIRYNIIISM